MSENVTITKEELKYFLMLVDSFNQGYYFSFYDRETHSFLKKMNELAAEAPAAPVTCTYCGAGRSQGEMFCWGCGQTE